MRRGMTVWGSGHKEVARRMPKRSFRPSLIKAMFSGIWGHGRVVKGLDGEKAFGDFQGLSWKIQSTTPPTAGKMWAEWVRVIRSAFDFSHGKLIVAPHVVVLGSPAFPAPWFGRGSLVVIAKPRGAFLHGWSEGIFDVILHELVVLGLQVHGKQSSDCPQSRQQRDSRHRLEYILIEIVLFSWNFVIGRNIDVFALRSLKRYGEKFGGHGKQGWNEPAAERVLNQFAAEGRIWALG
jgi:hypothetical protein